LPDGGSQALAFIRSIILYMQVKKLCRFFHHFSGLLRQFRGLGEVTLLPLKAEKKKFIMKMSLKMRYHVHTVKDNRTLHILLFGVYRPVKWRQQKEPG
jgi:hypothetical protein